jgi:archaellum component FlaC
MSDPEGRFTPGSVRAIKGRGGPYIMVVKRDGATQPFNRATMVESIRRAGATTEQADLVTNRISQRLVDRNAVPSSEMSTMVARSLSHVNSTASQNYVANRELKLAYTQRMNMMAAEIAAINQNVNYVTNNIENFDDRIQSLQARITTVRQGNYRALTHLEKDQASLSTAWTELSPQLRKTTSLNGEIIRTRTQNLQQTLNQKLASTDYDPRNLGAIESGIPELRSSLSQMQNATATAMSPLEKRFQAIDKDLRKAESTVSIVSQASFPWENAESPIVAAKVKDLNKDLEGFLTLTNHRFIFESEKEIVLKKVLFVVTEKKTVRETVIQKPIGMVNKLVQGKVGFLRGSGFFVEFAPESGIPEMKLDTSGQEAEWIVESYNYITSGRAEEELAALTPETTANLEKLQLVVCSVCVAPYREKIYRGQTSVNCKYCGAIINISQR